MEEKREMVHIETVGEKMSNGWARFKKGFVKYSKVNYLAYFCGLLMILFLVFEVLPAASIVVSKYYLSTNVEGVPTIVSFEGNATFAYSFFDMIFGRIEQLPVTIVPAGAPLDGNYSYFCYFVTFNVLLGLGILCLAAAVVLAFINRRIPRIIGAILGVIGMILVCLFTYNQIGYTLPIMVKGAQIDYAITWLAGPVIEIIIAIAIGALSVIICVFDIRRRNEHARSESARYLRGGI